MVSKHLPGRKYIAAVRAGTEQQQERANKLQAAVQPVMASLSINYDRNHLSDLVRDAFKR